MNNRDSRTVHWNAVSFVISSNYRVLVLDHLAEKPEIPSQISSNEYILIEHISRALRELRENGLVELRVPEGQAKERFYGITEKGEQAWHQMQTVDLI